MKKTIFGLLLTMLLALMPSAFAEKEYTYSIQDMFFSDLSGNPINEINNSCLVNVIVSKNAYRPNIDSIVIASYATDGEFIGFSMMRGSTSVGTDTQFATLVRPPEGKKIGKVKAYVWNNISEMVPLSKTSEIIVNEITGETQEQEKYIPDYFEICAVLAETPKSHGNLDNNQYILSGISCLYDYSDCYTAEQYNKKKERYDAIYEYYSIEEYNNLIVLSDDDLNEYIFQYLKFTLGLDEYGNYVVKNVTPIAGTNSVTLDLALIDDDKYSYTEILDALTSYSPYLYVYSSENAARSTKYKLEQDFKLLVNGVEVDNFDENLEKYIVNNTVGNIKLIDTYKSASGYDIVSVDYYDTTMVTSTSVKNIYVKMTDGLKATSISRDAERLEDEEITMNVYLNGELVAPSEIKKNDILSIKYDVNAGKNTSFYDIFISRDITKGKFTGRDLEDQNVTIDGKKYNFVDWQAGNAEFAKSKMGNEYRLFLDIFGRIYTQEELSQYAIVLKWINQQSTWNNDGLRLYFADGTYKNIEFSSNVKVEGSIATSLTELKNQFNSTTNISNIQQKVVKYKLNSSDKITNIELLEVPSKKNADFNKANSMLGSMVMNNETKIIYASEFTEAVGELVAANIDMLVDNTEYEAYFYGIPSITDNALPFVLVTNGYIPAEEESKPEVEPEIVFNDYVIVLELVSQSSWDNDGLKIYFTNGTYKNVEFASNIKFEGSVATNRDDFKSVIGRTTAKDDIMKKVAKCSINSDDKITNIELLDVPTKNTANYDEKNSKIDNITLGSKTKIIDASRFDGAVGNLDIANWNIFVDGVEYEAYAYGEPTNNVYPFVLITEAKGFYNANTSFAVVTKDMYPSIKDDGEEGYMLEVLFEGSEEVQALFVDEDAVYDEAIAGDVIVFQKDIDGDLKEVNVIFSNPDFGTMDFSYDALRNFDEDITLPTDDWDTAWVSTKDMETSLVFGPIVERNGRKYLAQVYDYKTYFGKEPSMGMTSPEGATMNIFTTADTNVYVYDINAARNDRFYVGTADDIIATYTDYMAYYDGDYYTIDWSYAEADDQINFAFAKLVDGVVTDIFVIVGVE